jgi:hypothetical protein
VSPSGKAAVVVSAARADVVSPVADSAAVAPDAGGDAAVAARSCAASAPAADTAATPPPPAAAAAVAATSPPPAATATPPPPAATATPPPPAAASPNSDSKPKSAGLHTKTGVRVVGRSGPVADTAAPASAFSNVDLPTPVGPARAHSSGASGVRRRGRIAVVRMCSISVRVRRAGSAVGRSRGRVMAVTAARSAVDAWMRAWGGGSLWSAPPVAALSETATARSMPEAGLAGELVLENSRRGYVPRC